jgi:hypothetical protein
LGLTNSIRPLSIQGKRRGISLKMIYGNPL